MTRRHVIVLFLASISVFAFGIWKHAELGLTWWQIAAIVLSANFIMIGLIKRGWLQ